MLTKELFAKIIKDDVCGMCRKNHVSVEECELHQNRCNDAYNRQAEKIANEIKAHTDLSDQAIKLLNSKIEKRDEIISNLIECIHELRYNIENPKLNNQPDLLQLLIKANGYFDSERIKDGY